MMIWDFGLQNNSIVGRKLDTADSTRLVTTTSEFHTGKINYGSWL